VENADCSINTILNNNETLHKQSCDKRCLSRLIEVFFLLIFKTKHRTARIRISCKSPCKSDRKQNRFPLRATYDENLGIFRLRKTSRMRQAPYVLVNRSFLRAAVTFHGLLIF